MKALFKIITLILTAIALYCTICGYLDNDPAAYVTALYMTMIALLFYAMSIMVDRWVVKDKTL